MDNRFLLCRRSFIGGIAATSASIFASSLLVGCSKFGKDTDLSSYNIVILGDTHYDTEPESVYHSKYDEKVE